MVKNNHFTLTIEIKILFVLANIKYEYERLRHAIRTLEPLQWEDGVSIYFDGYLAMCDGAIVNEMTETRSTHRCPVCTKLPREYRGLKPEDHTFTLRAWDAIENMVICKFALERLLKALVLI